jgi:hypothetical protein
MDADRNGKRKSATRAQGMARKISPARPGRQRRGVTSDDKPLTRAQIKELKRQYELHHDLTDSPSAVNFLALSGVLGVLAVRCCFS